MTITASLPQQPNSPIGPGAPQDVLTDLSLVPTPSLRWELSINLGTNPQEVFWRETFPFLATRQVLITGGGSKTVAPRPLSIPEHGGSGQIQWRIFNVGTQVDIGGQNITWNTTAFIGELIRSGGGSGAGGFTPDDRTTITDTHTAVTAQIQTQDATSSVSPISLANYFRRPPGVLLRRAEALVISGSGSLQRRVGLNPVSAYGALINFTVIPPGYGFTLGHTKEYGRRLGQFTLVRHDLNGNESIDQVGDFFSAGQRMEWDGNPFPERLDYDIAPGVTAQLIWLVFLGDQ